MSFHEVFTPLLWRSRQLAYRLLGDDDAARDVASEALARLYEHWHTLDHDLDHCTAWTLRVTRNLAIDTLRQRARERQLPDDDLAVVDTSSELALRLAVLDAVRDLPERQRRVIALRYLLDLSQADVAAALGVHPGTVATHVSRALARLRQALDIPAAKPAPSTPRQERTPMKITTIKQATALIGTDQPFGARITGRTDNGAFTADIGIPALYYGRGQRRPRWAPNHPDTLVGAEFDCVVIDIDDQQRAIITDALTGEDATQFRRHQDQVRNLRAGDRFTGRVAVVLPFGALVDFEGLRGLVPISRLDHAAPLAVGQDVQVEVVDTDTKLARISLRITG
jgi:RNA polymerase sigma factor (sigma-70 family)